MAYQPQFMPPGSSSAPSGVPGYPPPNAGYGPQPEYPRPAYPGPVGYPAGPPGTYVIQQPHRPQRPAVVAMSASMTVSATALWVCALATAWLFAAAGQARLAADQDFDGQVLIMLNRFSARLLDGLAIPLFGLPAIAFVAAFTLLSGRRWAQVFYSLLGAVSIGWLVWWLHLSPVWAVAPIAYILICVAILWTPAAIRWFGPDRG
ncbi:hypothetical protein [Microlunatus ginsengisoli]|uniref:Uncharacterized protein n=1 Tax=Microlunatus ginsengisoli TaxID=363863 RepID=A0ABP7A565_9ACTN